MPADGKAQWNFATPVSITLKDAAGNIVAKPTCAASDTVAVTIAPDCTTATGNRVGVQTITASGGGVSQTFTVRVIPQKQLIGTVGSTSNGDYNMVVTSQGKIMAWGINNSQVLGQNQSNTTLPFSALPVPVKDEAGTGNLTSIAAASAGYDSALAVNEDGEVFSWGNNANAQLGRTVANSTGLPGKVRNPANTGVLNHIAAVSLGKGASVALSDDGTVYTWGYSGLGQGTSVSTSPYPNQVKDLSGVGILQSIVAVSSGNGFTMALNRDGQVYVWGNNRATRNGVIVLPTTTIPVLIKKPDGTALNNIVSFSAGYQHSLMLSADGTVYCWGDNTYGPLGIGTLNDLTTTAIQVKDTAGTGILAGITSVSAGGNSSYATDVSGSVLAWGRSVSGQLGDGPNRPVVNQTPLPRAVVSPAGTGQLTGVIGVASGYEHALSLMPDGTITTFGSGYLGILGQGDTRNAAGSWPDSAVPLAVKDQAGTGDLNVGPLTVTRDTYRRFR